MLFIEGTIPSAIRDPCSIIECPHHGTCHVVNGKGVCQCKLFCPLDAKPVCGSNGNTYANECILKSESCVSKKTIKIEHKGPCGGFLVFFFILEFTSLTIYLSINTVHQLQ